MESDVCSRDWFFLSAEVCKILHLDVFSFNDNYCYREKISAQTELLSSDVDIHQELVRLICLTRSI